MWARCSALSLEHCRRVTFAPDGLLVLTGLASVATLNLQVIAWLYAHSDMHPRNASKPYLLV